MSTMITAACQCGNVTFKATEKPVKELCCHCTDCRSAVDDDYATISFFKTGTFEINGDVAEYEFVSDAGNETVRQYCPNCGDVMFDRSKGIPMLVGVMSAQILPPFESAPDGHVWVSSKLAHVTIPEGTTQWRKGYTQV